METYALRLVRETDSIGFFGASAAFGSLVAVMALNIVHDTPHQGRHVMLHHTRTSISTFPFRPHSIP